MKRAAVSANLSLQNAAARYKQRSAA